MSYLKCALLAALVGGLASGAEFPGAEISNGLIEAKLYLPDAEKGYYRGTRFDWSGVIHSLRYKGHEFFGQWFERYDPVLHDAIMGPVEEFLTGETALGYAEAKPGGTFIRIGVGAVRKPDEQTFQRFHTYELVNPGKWRVAKAADRVEFTHELTDETSGYAYLYRKTVRLAKDRPELAIEHSLRNTGRRVIETSQYNHNFFVIDGQPTGPDFAVRFPFNLRAAADLKGIGEVRGRELAFLRELQPRESLFSELQGYGAATSDYDITVENRKTGAAVRITGDKPLSKLIFWCVRATLCPEPYIDMRIEPGAESQWRLVYRFSAR